MNWDKKCFCHNPIDKYLKAFCQTCEVNLVNIQNNCSSLTGISKCPAQAFVERTLCAFIESFVADFEINSLTSKDNDKSLITLRLLQPSVNVVTWSNQEECSGTTDATSSEHLQHEEVCVPQVSGDENAFSGLSAQGPVYTMSSLERKFALGWEDVEMGRSSERTRGAEGTTSRYNCSDDTELVKGDGQSLTRQSNESTATPHSMSSFETFLAVKKSGEDGRLNFIKESPSRKFSNFSHLAAAVQNLNAPLHLILI